MKKNVVNRLSLFALSALATSALCVSPFAERSYADENGAANEQVQTSESPKRSFGGIYPCLGYHNDENECGTGAVVPWADKLWFVTYGPHLPNGSSDKLYELDADLNLTIRPESVGGTNANRMIHRESQQLFIGNHAIDAQGNVRTIPHKEMYGRETAVARHLTDPENKVYFLTMEEGLYEVDVHTLQVRELCKDGNLPRKPGEDVLPGYHGKGGYTSQGRVVYTNNGEQSEAAKFDPTIPSGCLAQWFGEDKGWEVVRRTQFTEATGPGGIEGADPNDDVLWSLGWDAKSLLLYVLENGKWNTFRLPKGSHCYDGAHGWNTEWPRIRKIDDEDVYLATMHGTFWAFPRNFKASRAAGIRPRSTYLKVVGDWAYWNGRVVFGCDDSAKSEFLNKTAFKPGIAGPGKSNSNLWFVEPERLSTFGPALGRGAVWSREDVAANVPSDPYLAAGYDCREMTFVYDANSSDKEITLTLEGDVDGTGNWQELAKYAAKDGCLNVKLPESFKVEWFRVTSNASLKNATCFFHYKNVDTRKTQPDAIFNGVARPEDANEFLGATLWTRADNQRLAVVSEIVKDGKVAEERYYELTKDATLERVPCKFEGGEPGTISRIKGFVGPQEVPADVCTIDDLSVLVHYKGQAWRLPIGSEEAARVQSPLICRLDREVATERDLFHCAGTFYELPAENAGGLPKIRPIATDGALLSDYASYRGMLVLGGIKSDPSQDSDRVVRSDDGQCALWLGTIDDLWAFGKPVGRGYVWKDQEVKSGDVSDPMLATGFDKPTIVVNNHSDKPLTIAIEYDPTCEGLWQTHRKIALPAGGEVVFDPKGLPDAYWMRARSLGEGKVSVMFDFSHRLRRRSNY